MLCFTAPKMLVCLVISIMPDFCTQYKVCCPTAPHPKTFSQKDCPPWPALPYLAKMISLATVNTLKESMVLRHDDMSGPGTPDP